MVKAGVEYIGITQIEEWPVSCETIVSEIAQAMNVTVDSRTVLHSEYMVDYPDDLLMSEVLAMIAAMHGGTWVITAENKLRLIPYPNPDNLTVVQDLGKEYTGYTAYSTGHNTVSRITLTDNAGNEFSYGNDDGRELGAKCFYATAPITQAVYESIKDAVYQPYEISLAYCSNLLEVGDAVTITTRKGEQKKLVVGNIKNKLGIASRATLGYGVEEDDEEEIPYVSADDLRASRTISTLGTYYGNRLNRKEGLVSDYVKDGEVVATLVANANEFSMKQKMADGTWKSRIYFDATAGKYVIDGDVTINALEQINQEIKSQGGESQSLYDWIHNGSYKMTSAEFNVMLNSDADYSTFYGDVMVGEGSVKQKADYVFSSEGFNAKLQSDESYSALEESVLGDGDPDSQVTKSSVKYKADYVFSTEGFNAKLSADSSFQTASGNASSAKQTAEYVASASGFNAILQANQDYTTQKATISATASGLSSKVEANGVISAINQSSESVTISAGKINLNGAASFNNNVTIGTNGVITAKGGTFTSATVTGTLTSGNWTFNSSGSVFNDNNGHKSTVAAWSGQSYSDGYECADNPSDYRMFFGAEGCDMMYGCQDQNNYSHNMFLRAKRIILMSGPDLENKAILGQFIDDEGGGTDISFFPAVNDTGNIGSSSRRWNLIRYGSGGSSGISSKYRKTNIKPFEDCGWVFDKLEPVTFDWIDNGKPGVGFILEDTMEFLPIICDIPEDGNTKNGGIFYERMIPFLTREIQSLRKRIKRLEEVA